MVLPLAQPNAYLRDVDWYVDIQDTFYLLARRMIIISMHDAQVGESRDFLLPIMIVNGINHILETCHFRGDRVENNIIITLCCRNTH